MMHTPNSWLRNLFFSYCLILTGCSTSPVIEETDGLRHAPPAPSDLADIPDPMPQIEPFSRYGNPDSYEVFGREYRPLKDFRGYREKGIASWYGSKFHGQRTSSGEPYDMFSMTAAHKTLPIPCYTRVTNLKNGRSIIVRVNDRGPFHDNRLIDLSYTAAWKLGIVGEGTGVVEVAAIDPRQMEPTAPRLPQPTAIQSVATNDVDSAPFELATIQTVVKEKPELPGLFLQVGAFGDVANARRLKSQLESELQMDVWVEQHKIADAPIYRVRVGPIASVELCDHLTNQLNGMGIPETRLVVR